MSSITTNTTTTDISSAERPKRIRLSADAAAAANTVPNNDDKVFSYTSGNVTASASVVEFGSSFQSTGICFLDHMVDQLTSHGQLGVTLHVVSTDGGGVKVEHQPHVDYAGGSLREGDRLHDDDIFIAAGTALGMALRQLVVSRTTGSHDDQSSPSSSASVFCCPLDESFCEAQLELLSAASSSSSSADSAAGPASSSVSLAPYGTMPPQGRRWIGCYRCNLTPVFFRSLVDALGGGNCTNSSSGGTSSPCCSYLRLRKVRGHNAHHIVESTFKAFARVFRACLDGLTMGGNHGQVAVEEDRLSARRRLLEDGTATKKREEEHRTGSRSRSTKETTIEVNVNLDRQAPSFNEQQQQHAVTSNIHTGVELMDLVLGELRQKAGFHFDVHCDGDTYIDDHHTVEDVAITLGQCLNQALGSKAGMARMGCAQVRVGNTDHLVRAVMDLSNRPFFEWNLPFDEEYVGGDDEGFAAMQRGASGTTSMMLCGSALTCEMLLHVFESLTIETRATVHLELIVPNNGQEEYVPKPGHTRDLALAAARAFGTALAECVRVDPRRAGKVASSKGTLSV